MLGTLSALPQAFAETSTTSGMTLVGTPSGLSAYDPGTPASGTTAATSPTIFGGNAGSGGECASPVATSTCNSCKGGTTLTSCNPTSVHPNLILSVSMSSSTASLFQGTPKLIWRFTEETPGVVHDVENTPSLAAGQTITAEIKWGDLCAAAGGDGTCTTNIATTKTLSVGIDNNNDGVLEEKVDFSFAFRYVTGAGNLTASCPVGVSNPAIVATEGICDYTVFRGDEKVYITDYAATSNDLETANSPVKYNRIALFYSENSQGQADPSTITTSSPSITLSLNNNSPNEPSLSDQRITGLQNGTDYCFALGNMDQAGNITYFPVATELADASKHSKFCATPDVVVGLLDDKHCFIATATYGSMMAPEVNTFRAFRNKFLLTNSFGKAFVKAYYQLGPEAAEWISHSEFLRTLSLWMLWPLLMFAKLALAWGLAPASLIALIGLLALRTSVSLVRAQARSRGDV